MFAEIYAIALIADERAADAIFNLWESGVISDEWAALAWLLLANLAPQS
jgi:hypothetical protein